MERKKIAGGGGETGFNFPFHYLRAGNRLVGYQHSHSHNGEVYVTVDTDSLRRIQHWVALKLLMHLNKDSEFSGCALESLTLSNIFSILLFAVSCNVTLYSGTRWNSIPFAWFSKSIIFAKKITMFRTRVKPLSSIFHFLLLSARWV